MKRLIAVLSGLLVLPAFAEVAPISYDEIVEYSETEMVEPDAAETAAEEVKVITPVAQPSKASPRGTASSRAASRAVPSTTKSVNSRSVSARSTASSRNATQARTGTITAVRNAVSSRGTTSRVAARPSRNATTAATGVASRRAVDTNQTVAARAGSLTQTDTVNTPLYTGRVGTRTSANIQSRMRSSSAIGLTGVSASTNNALSELTDIDELAQNTAYCKAQYTSCMDNFCNVLDDNQGRCSCSKNLKNYAKTEEALKQATIALEEVAQQIRYIGLSADQVESLFAETEAEIALSDSKNNDTSAIAKMMANIKKMVIEIEPGSVSKTDTGVSITINGLLEIGDLTDGLFNLDSLNIFGDSSKTNSISNQRGEQLYKTAAARCKTAVLDTCASQGVDTSIITNSYDLEIDKQCIAYERTLTEANETMASTVRNAKTVLQNARLMVAQQKNAYTLRECVEQLDVCMREDFVCGDDYENCLDPTGRYIAGGKIVLGSTPGQSTVSEKPTNTLYATWNYTPKGGGAETYAWGAIGTLGAYIDTYMTDETPKEDLEYMANYLQSKIGYINDTGKAIGLCSGVLNQCQDYTYTTDGNTRSATKKYNPDNQVIRNYLERTLVQVKAAQDTLVEEYAEDCITQEVSTCLNQNDYDETHSKTALSACKQQITTCMSVNGVEPDDKDGGFSPEKMGDWVLSITGEPDAAVSYYRYTINCMNSNGKVDKDSDGNLTCACGTNATAADDGTCSCNTGYTMYDGVCTNVKKISCITSGGDWNTGTSPSSCDCPDGKELEDNACVDAN